MISRLLQNLQSRSLFDHRVDQFELLETHISWVLLTGQYAYKIKKPVNFEFVDFSSLSKRRFCCYEELRLNRRLAPDLYLDVCEITGSIEAPVIGGPGPAIEYMVKMKQFDQCNLLGHLVSQKTISANQIRSLAKTIGDFHQRIDSAGLQSGYGKPEQIDRWVLQNFQQIRPLLPSPPQAGQLDRLENWTAERFQSLRQMMSERKRRAFIRECHGDLHLGNIALINDRLTVFDGIEFNPELRWIDTASEIAFLLMDLYDHGKPTLANIFLDQYLAVTGDYDGLAMLPFYLVYRALVRAKINLLTSARNSVTDVQHHSHLVRGNYQGYLDLALDFTARPPAVLYITHGLAGSGKSTLARQMAQRSGVVRIRSDVERKRMFGLAADQRTGSGPGSGIYTADATRDTYENLSMLAKKVLSAGYSVIIDAGFLQRWQRHMFQQLAEELDVEFAILELQAPVGELRRRVTDRWEKRRDASEATIEVLEMQLKQHQPLTSRERGHLIEIESSADSNLEFLNKIDTGRRLQQPSSSHSHRYDIRS